MTQYKDILTIKFQFLMVRLKDDIFVFKTFQFNSFQFLMVRLKVIQRIVNIWRIAHFNSLWCD